MTVGTLEWILSILAIVAAVWGGSWQIVRKLQMFVGYLDEKIETKVEEATRPLHTNGGEGLADVPQRLDAIQAAQADYAKENLAAHEEMRKEIGKMAYRLELVEGTQVGMLNKMNGLPPAA